MKETSMCVKYIFLFFSVSWVVLLTRVVMAGEDTNMYENGERVRVYGNKIGRANNAFETYDFFYAPGCRPLNSKSQRPMFGHTLVGDKLRQMNVHVDFGKDAKQGVICEFTPTVADAMRWSKMITSGYVYQLVVDGLPLSAALGETANGEGMIYTHRNFDFGVNGQQFVDINLEPGNLEKIQAGRTYVFTYSARFFPSGIAFEDRFAKYVDKSVFVFGVRWLVLANCSLVTLLLVIIVTTFVVRINRTEYLRAGPEHLLGNEITDEALNGSGWKQLYADVYRVPLHPIFLCALVGTGVQLLCMFALGIALAVLFSLLQRPLQSLFVVVVVLYAVTGVVAGFVSSVQFLWYATLSPVLSKRWMRCMGLTVFFPPFCLVLSGFITNTIAHIQVLKRTIHIDGIVFFWAFLTFGFFPSVVLGTFIGRYAYRRYLLILCRRELPHVNQIPRIIPPPSKFFLSNRMLIILSGLLPFFSLLFELSLLLCSFWMNKPYYTYTPLGLTFALFVLLTCCVSIAATYVLLDLENYKWPWMSFGFGASCGLYVYIYSIYFYLFCTTMNGFCAFVFYCVCSATVSAAISIMGGSLAFLTASLFIQKIYGFLKSD